MKNILFGVLLLVSVNVAAQSDKEAILSILQQQQQAWNEGDLVGFMQGYWKSDELAFVGKSGLKYGWQTTLDNYKKSYPDVNAMGKLTFEILNVDIAGETAFVLGRWSLLRKADNPNGHFTLLWKKIEGQWKVVIDHSS